MPESTLPTNRLRESLGYLNWLYNPFQALDAAGIYDLLSTSSPTERGLYLNLGYWRDASDLDTASDALAMLVGERAGLGPADQVLDCGYGFGDQDILWAQTLKPKQIIGLNITSSQVEVARRRVSKLGLDEQVDLRQGSATEMPIDSGSVDKVVAVECAFHFRTRERFFREAWRVLRPGGRLVLADILPMPKVSGFQERLEQRISWRLVAGKFAIPPENAYTRPTYHSKLAMAGFEQIEIESIRGQVYAPLHRFLAEHPDTLARLHPMARLPAQVALRFEATSVYRGLDYVLASAVKPKQLLGPGGRRR
jgi:ubiquinone/menaquinone biosynthesis C-methylase UbiE